MSLQAVLLPLFVQVLLTFVLGIWMASLRRSALVNRDVRFDDIALRQPNWPPRQTQIANAFHNQLEIPVLFYVLTILAIIAKQTDLLFVLLSWVFVALRVIHASVHVTSNRVPRRGAIFLASVLVLFIMWIIFMIRILLAI
jgi:hypothetical protein